MTYIWANKQDNKSYCSLILLNIILFELILNKYWDIARERLRKKISGGQKCPWGGLKNFGIGGQALMGGHPISPNIGHT